jgi:hypothetical protein
MKKKYAIAIALAAFAVWWMQAKGYEKGRERIFAAHDSCMARLSKNDPDGTFYKSNLMYCDSIYRPSDMNDIGARLYELLVR